MNNALWLIHNLSCVHALVVSFRDCYPSTHNTHIHASAHLFRKLLWAEWKQQCGVMELNICRENKITCEFSAFALFKFIYFPGCAFAHLCVDLCARISMTAFRATLLGQLFLPHLRSSVRIIKPISSLWLLQPACDWIATPTAAIRSAKRKTEGWEE